MQIIYISILQTITVIIPIVILGVRLEHRITKIETDVKWIKDLAEIGCGKKEKG